MAPQRPPRRGNQPARGPQNKSNRPADRKGPPPRPKPATRRPAATARPRGPRPPSLPGEDRLQKILAHAGVGSRRACEELILQGRVTVDGQVIRELGTKVDPRKTAVALDGQKIQLERPVYFAVFKPKGYVSTNNDPSGRPRVLDLLPEIPQRVYTVGRLDEMSMGLMLLTNDGELANKLAHPRFGVEKLYRVIVAGLPTREVLKQLTDGIWLAEGKVRAKSVRAVARKGEATILEMVLAEGKNREVRRMLAKLGHKVMLLTRVAVGPITVKGLTAGQFRPLTGREVDLLRRVAAGEPVPMPWTSERKSSRPMPERPRRGATDGPPGSQGGGDRPAHGPRYAAPQGAPRRPEGPGGYRQNSGEPTRRAGPRPSENGPPRRPGEYRSDQSQGGLARGPAGYRQGPGGPPRRPEGPGAYRPGPGGPPRRFEGPGARPPRPGDGPSGGHRPGAGRPQAMAGGPPPRPEGRGGPRPYNDRPGDDRRPGPRPPQADRRPADGPPGNRRPGAGRSQAMENGPPRPQGRAAARPSNQRPGDDRRPGSRPPQADRRPGPSSDDQPRRKVIGLDQPEAAPPPPSRAASPPPPRDDRPKPRMKRPPGKRPAPRPASGPRPMPRRRRDGGGPSE